MNRPHRITAALTAEQYQLARRRLFTERQSWQKVLNALINAYITGDITVTDAGRYHLKPPQAQPIVVHIPKGADLIEVDIDWGTPNKRPQVGAGNSSQQPKVHKAWGTKALAQYLREQTGRKITLQSLRYMLRVMEIEKKHNNRWEFQGPDDPVVAEVLDAIITGLYDDLVRMGTDAASAIRIHKENQEKTAKQALLANQAERRMLHLKRLRSIEK